MAEAFGLDRRIENYQGKRPIGLFSWDFDCLLAVIEDALDDPKEYPDKNESGYKALKSLFVRLKGEYRKFEQRKNPKNYRINRLQRTSQWSRRREDRCFT